jgi:predicted DNA-binding transcriptional regulator AlpA
MVGLDVACAALGISKNTAYSLLRDGSFPVPAKRIGGTWKVSTAALARFTGDAA